MGLDPHQLRDLIVRPVLAYLGLPGGEVAERLVMGTAAHESGGFRYIKQVGGGPALSLWQIEPATARDAIGRAPQVVLEKLHAMSIFLPGLPGNPGEQIINELPGNLYLGAAMCRAVYYLKPFAMPSTATVEDLAFLWKKHWNSEEGAGRPGQFVAAYNEHIAHLYDEPPSG